MTVNREPNKEKDVPVMRIGHLDTRNSYDSDKEQGQLVVRLRKNWSDHVQQTLIGSTETRPKLGLSNEAKIAFIAKCSPSRYLQMVKSSIYLSYLLIPISEKKKQQKGETKWPISHHWRRGT